MSTDTTPRRGFAERITGAIWGAIVTTVGGLLIAALSGYDIDLELVAILSLAALGGWLLFSAVAVAVRQQSRRPQAPAAPETATEPEAPAEPGSEQPR